MGSTKRKSRSEEEIENRIKFLLSNKSLPKTTSVPRKKVKRPPGRKFLLNSPIEQPLSDKVKEIKDRKEEAQNAKITYVSQKSVSYFITENDEDIIHRK